MKLIVTNPTGSHCFIGHTSHPGIDIAPVSKNAGPQEFEVPESLVGYFTRSVNAVIPLAVVTLGDEQAEAEAQAAAEAEAAQAQAQADADAAQAEADAAQAEAAAAEAAAAEAAAQAAAAAQAGDGVVQDKRNKSTKTK